MSRVQQLTAELSSDIRYDAGTNKFSELFYCRLRHYKGNVFVCFDSCDWPFICILGCLYVYSLFIRAFARACV